MIEAVILFRMYHFTVIASVLLCVYVPMSEHVSRTCPSTDPIRKRPLKCAPPPQAEMCGDALVWLSLCLLYFLNADTSLTCSALHYKYPFFTSFRNTGGPTPNGFPLGDNAYLPPLPMAADANPQPGNSGRAGVSF